jgi:hypothetical protein
MKKPLFILLFLSFVIIAKSQQNNKPADTVTGKSEYTSTPQQTAPEPPGGLEVFMKYMNKYVNHYYNNADAGKVTVTFVVEKDGSLTGYKITQSLNAEADGVCIQALKDNDHKWKPAMQNGQPVSAPYTITVSVGKN